MIRFTNWYIIIVVYDKWNELLIRNYNCIRQKTKHRFRSFPVFHVPNPGSKMYTSSVAGLNTIGVQFLIYVHCSCDRTEI